MLKVFVDISVETDTPSIISLEHSQSRSKHCMHYPLNILNNHKRFLHSQIGIFRYIALWISATVWSLKVLWMGKLNKYNQHARSDIFNIKGSNNKNCNVTVFAMPRQAITSHYKEIFFMWVKKCMYVYGGETCLLYNLITYWDVPCHCHCHSASCILRINFFQLTVSLGSLANSPRWTYLKTVTLWNISLRNFIFRTKQLKKILCLNAHVSEKNMYMEKLHSIWSLGLFFFYYSHLRKKTNM